ncbi:2746_t:CDS:2, partial [Racocetra persica]
LLREVETKLLVVTIGNGYKEAGPGQGAEQVQPPLSQLQDKPEQGSVVEQ